MIRLSLVAAVVATIGVLNAAPHADAQSFPSRPVTIIVPYPAGGPTDTIARLLGDRMRASLGQTVVIENVAGAGGNIGVGRVVRAAPDGYTISIGHWGSHVVNGAIYSLPYDLLADFEPVALVSEGPQLIVTAKNVPAKNLHGIDRMAQGQSRQDHAGHDRRRRRLASCRHPVPEGDRHGIQIVPYRGARAAHAGHAGGPHPPGV